MLAFTLELPAHIVIIPHMPASHSDADVAPSSASAIAADACSDGSWVLLRGNSTASDSDWASTREVGDSAVASKIGWGDVRSSENVDV